MLPPLLKTLGFKGNNTAYRPVMDAMRLLEKYVGVDGKTRFYDAADEVRWTASYAGGSPPAAPPTQSRAPATHLPERRRGALNLNGWVGRRETGPS
ncbi:hypothetical protein ACIQVC_22440 [Streptomyces sp. NPDC101112]|jgi:hypothetical protein|uniref:hypothetical protein n=1 Tax=Streptomyces sp. NPDC101112 TaxID=3366105 RepID=UPI00382AABBF